MKLHIYDSHVTCLTPIVESTVSVEYSTKTTHMTVLSIRY